MQPKANVLIELRSAMNLWQNNAKPTHPKTQKTEFMDTGHVNKHSYPAIVLYMAVIMNLVPKHNLHTINLMYMLLTRNSIPCEIP